MVWYSLSILTFSTQLGATTAIRSDVLKRIYVGESLILFHLSGLFTHVYFFNIFL